jgi:hypothetical protein
MPHAGFWWGLTAIPVVVALTFAAKRWPPPISNLSLRRLAFMLLLISGLSLALPVLLNIMGDFS